MGFLICFNGDFEAVRFENVIDFLFCFLNLLRSCFTYLQIIFTVETSLAFKFQCDEGQHVGASEFACLGSSI